MNAQDCWNELCAAHQQRDWPLVEKRASALMDWLDRGGAAPMVDPAKTPAVNVLIARVACSDLIRRSRLLGASGSEVADA